MSMNTIDYMKELTAGGLAGMLGLAVGYPFDTIKTHQQVGAKTMGATCIDIIKHQGFRGFFRGMTGPFITYGAVFAVFFASYGVTLDYWVSRDGRSSRNPGRSAEDLATYKEIFVAGCIGGAVQSIPAAPVELVKVQMQIGGKKKSPSLVKTVKKVYALRGLRGFGIGMGATLLRDVHSHGVYSLVFKAYLDNICGSSYFIVDSSDKPSMLCQFVAGGFAGTLYWWSCIPMDAIKSRLQGDRISSPVYKNFLDCAIKTIKNEGMKPFVRGTWAITLRAFPSNGCIFLAHSQLNKIFDSFIDKHGLNPKSPR